MVEFREITLNIMTFTLKRSFSAVMCVVLLCKCAKSRILEIVRIKIRNSDNHKIWIKPTDFIKKVMIISRRLWGQILKKWFNVIYAEDFINHQLFLDERIII